MSDLEFSSTHLLDSVLAVVLGGGRGERLDPLTRLRAKPAVPFAGNYRLVDIAISNCLNSGIQYVAVLTQYHALSLYRHISNTYQTSSAAGGWVQTWSAEQTAGNENWYQGTADAVRQHLDLIRSTGAPYVLVLPGDQLCKINFVDMAWEHIRRGADVTVALHPVSGRECYRYGILKTDPTGKIVEFVEKPTHRRLLDRMVSRRDPALPYLASMGIYLFSTSALMRLLENTPDRDFGNDVLPHAVRSMHVHGFEFSEFWEDIGAIRSYYEASLALTHSDSPLNLHAIDRPIYQAPNSLPGPLLENTILEHVLLSPGCRIQSAQIRQSILGPCQSVRERVRITDSILFGSEPCGRIGGSFRGADSGSTIESDCNIQGAILDYNVTVGAGSVILPFPRGVNFDADGWCVRDGIVVVLRNVKIPPGSWIGPGTEVNTLIYEESLGARVTRVS